MPLNSYNIIEELGGGQYGRAFLVQFDSGKKAVGKLFMHASHALYEAQQHQLAYAKMRRSPHPECRQLLLKPLSNAIILKPHGAITFQDFANPDPNKYNMKTLPSTH